jgi:uncharacterized membrane protein
MITTLFVKSSAPNNQEYSYARNKVAHAKLENCTCRIVDHDTCLNVVSEVEGPQEWDKGVENSGGGGGSGGGSGGGGGGHLWWWWWW